MAAKSILIGCKSNLIQNRLRNFPQKCERNGGRDSVSWSEFWCSSCFQSGMSIKGTRAFEFLAFFRGFCFFATKLMVNTRMCKIVQRRQQFDLCSRWFAQSGWAVVVQMIRLCLLSNAMQANTGAMSFSATYQAFVKSKIRFARPFGVRPIMC